MLRQVSAASSGRTPPDIKTKEDMMRHAADAAAKATAKTARDVTAKRINELKTKKTYGDINNRVKRFCKEIVSNNIKAEISDAINGIDETKLVNIIDSYDVRKIETKAFGLFHSNAEKDDNTAILFAFMRAHLTPIEISRFCRDDAIIYSAMVTKKMIEFGLSDATETSFQQSVAVAVAASRKSALDQHQYQDDDWIDVENPRATVLTPAEKIVDSTSSDDDDGISNISSTDTGDLNAAFLAPKTSPVADITGDSSQAASADAEPQTIAATQGGAVQNEGVPETISSAVSQGARVAFVEVLNANNDKSKKEVVGFLKECLKDKTSTELCAAARYILITLLEIAQHLDLSKVENPTQFARLFEENNTFERLTLKLETQFKEIVSYIKTQKATSITVNAILALAINQHYGALAVAIPGKLRELVQETLDSDVVVTQSTRSLVKMLTPELSPFLADNNIIINDGTGTTLTVESPSTSARTSLVNDGEKYIKVNIQHGRSEILAAKCKKNQINADKIPADQHTAVLAAYNKFKNQNTAKVFGIKKDHSQNPIFLRKAVFETLIGASTLTVTEALNAVKDTFSRDILGITVNENGIQVVFKGSAGSDIVCELSKGQISIMSNKKQVELFNLLTSDQKKQALERGVFPYTVLQDAVVDAISKNLREMPSATSTDGGVRFTLLNLVNQAIQDLPRNFKKLDPESLRNLLVPVARELLNDPSTDYLDDGKIKSLLTSAKERYSGGNTQNLECATKFCEMELQHQLALLSIVQTYYPALTGMDLLSKFDLLTSPNVQIKPTIMPSNNCIQIEYTVPLVNLSDSSEMAGSDDVVPPLLYMKVKVQMNFKVAEGKINGGADGKDSILHSVELLDCKLMSPDNVT